MECAQDRGEAEAGWRRWDVRLDPGVPPGDVLERCVAERFALRRFEQVQVSLHDVFVHIVGAPETAHEHNILLVAAREFRQIAGMRSFWLTLVIMPLSFVDRRVRAADDPTSDEADRVMVIDRTGGGEAHALEQRLQA